MCLLGFGGNIICTRNFACEKYKRVAEFMEEKDMENLRR